MAHAKGVEVVLVAHEREAPTERHDKLLDVLDYALLEHVLINVLGITNTELLHVDEVEQVFVLEGADGAQGLLAPGQRSEVIIWSLALVMKIVSFD